ncbi:MAG: LytTR family transcriptional regulator DNA-binding domain-containing protein, partial [Anaerorhabdus sp.]
MLKRIIAFLCSITIFIGIDYFLVDYLSTKKINLVSVYVASRDIKPRTIITDQDIREIKIPQAYVLENVINNKNNLMKIMLDDVLYMETEGREIIIHKSNEFYRFKMSMRKLEKLL